MVTVYIKSNIKDTQAFIGRVKQAIHKSKRNMAVATANRGKHILSTAPLGSGGAPKGVRSGTQSLRGSGIVQGFGDQATLSIRADNAKVGLVNELGMAEPKYLRFADFPELHNWAIKKFWAYNPNMKGMTVGKPSTTAFGKKNVFWIKLFNRLDKEVPRIMAQEIQKELQNVK